ncbi:MAG: NAD-dependent protein deacylase [Christensenellaceae bacterium]|nr:NAD-dependent protein deacylase [Christensenellaceae bacterium]
MLLDEQIKRLKKLVYATKSTVFFGGAGVSTESGIPDFRSPTGLYQAKQVFNRQPEYLLSHSCFIREPEIFFRYYKENLVARTAKPNPAHFALAKLEQQGYLSAIVTQNVDGLHQMAGSKTVYELHGTNWHQFCMQCGEQYSLDYILEQEGVPKCKKCGGIVRPQVVLYEESLPFCAWDGAVQAIESADLLIVGGTSLAVYPAAALLEHFNGSNLVLINKSETPADNRAQLVIRDAIGKVLSAAVENGHILKC